MRGRATSGWLGPRVHFTRPPPGILPLSLRTAALDSRCTPFARYNTPHRYTMYSDLYYAREPPKSISAHSETRWSWPPAASHRPRSAFSRSSMSSSVPSATVLLSATLGACRRANVTAWQLCLWYSSVPRLFMLLVEYSRILNECLSNTGAAINGGLRTCHPILRPRTSFRRRRWQQNHFQDVLSCALCRPSCSLHSLLRLPANRIVMLAVECHCTSSP